ncbi:sensor histidine kinase [Sphingomonas sp. JC676]|uniref:HAMP domain-containing sensor histidine kinase n=1 Tax=Sphingomonas sp. JC676 TaxID=2768065 RepID=UPI001657909A|nr:ATP-binding protein [Sphingomonas sp. JC676]MBC9033408.1 sensor histidine kinase [Sphingomonas sp. JC676]
MRPRSLRAIMAIYVTAVIIALILLRTVNYRITHDALEHEVDLRIASEATEIVDAGRGSDERAMAAWIATELGEHDSADLYLLLVDKAGRKLAGNLSLRTLPAIGYSDLGPEANVGGVDHGRALTRRLPGGGTLVVVADNDEVDSFDAMLSRVQLFGTAITALILIGGAVGITLAIRGRMRAMQRTVDAVIAGDLHSRIPLDGTRSEFDRQAAAFNRMLDRIDELMVNIKHAAKDVAHELKSPLARLRSRIAALERHSQGDPLEPEIAELREQTDQMLELFASLMRLWEIEGGHRRDRFASIDIAALASDVGEALQIVAEEAERPLTIADSAPLRVRGDLHLLRQLLVNLIENAIRHTPPGTRIALRVERRAHSVALVVADDGPGIPAAEHAVVVRKFGRLESAIEAPGQGLGLTLVDAIARLHHGRLTLEDAGPGLRAVVELPLHP